MVKLPKSLTERTDECGLKRIQGGCNRYRCQLLHPNKYRRCMLEERKFIKDTGWWNK